ncbi:MAG: GH15 [uncultured Acidimicrobiales bacterium]|uniref:GH15 n=1 Tax=uncultured Acidimicrobiales bacterium TaxID=310071 RepID=A0A6J4I8T2_9ACTN|nr:MAG: GH15 [uncultured Acidimicrobiales bacterium]
MIGGGDALPLRARGLIGDTATAALVAADGTIDWWCPTRFDAPAALFRLLDPGGGAVRAGPSGPPRAGVQSYGDRDNVLHTTLQAGNGAELEVTDFFPWFHDSPGGRIVRILEARRGSVDVEVDVVPGSAFGPARDISSWSEGMAFDGVVVRTGHPFDQRTSRLQLHAGERAVVTIDGPKSKATPLRVDDAFDLLDRTTTAWRSHLGPLTYAGPYREAVERSLLALKALTYGQTGTVVAAATTSLPEHVGSERNWDYRYAWIRDASLAIDASYDAGLTEESERFSEWLGGVLRGAELPLRPVFSVDGEPLEGGETELALAGWRRSQPVRVGNGAEHHLQLDFYADLVSGIHVEQMRDANSAVERMWPQLARMTDWLAEAWQQPDRGIWEIRSEPRHLVSSKLACWYALDRMAELAAARNPLDLDAFGWRTASREIVAWLERHGLAADGGLRADPSVADRADGYLSQVAWRSPWPLDHRIVTKTVDRTLQQLSVGPFVYRYLPDSDDGLPSGEGAFLACSFWAVEALARLGRWEEAHERMEALVTFSGPLGLLPEEADPISGDFLGNLPQALSHLALVQAALALAEGPT